MNKSALNYYGTTNLHSGLMDATPEKLIKLLLDGSCSRINNAIAALREGEIAKKGELIGKAVSIIAYLKSILDESAAPEFTGNLWNLYSYMESTLLSANIRNDEEKLREVVELLNEVRAGWDEMIKTGAYR